MANVRGLALAPTPLSNPGSSGTTSLTLDGVDDAVAWVFAAETDDPITHVGFRSGTVNVNPPQYRAALQGVTSGDPSGTVLGGGSPAQALFTPAQATNTWYTLELANPYTPTIGEIIACAVEYDSGTISSSNDFSIIYKASSTSFWSGNNDMLFPYSLSKTSSFWTKQDEMPIFGYKTASRWYGIPVLNIGQSLQLNTDGHRFAMKFRVPSDSPLATFTLPIIVFYLTQFSGLGNVKFGVWDAAGDAVSGYAISHDSSNFSISSGAGFAHRLFPNATSLATNTWYYVGIERDGFTISGRYQELDDESHRSAYRMGTNVCGATWNGSAWTDQETWLPAIGLELGEATAAGGGGGGNTVVFPHVIGS